MLMQEWHLGLAACTPTPTPAPPPACTDVIVEVVVPFDAGMHVTVVHSRRCRNLQGPG